MHRNFFVSCFNDFVSFKSLFNGWFEAFWSCTLCCLFYLKPVWADGVKSSPIFSESCPKSSQYSFFIIVRFFEIAQKVINHLGFFCYKFCCQDLSKIAQSGHTAWSIENVKAIRYGSNWISVHLAKKVLDVFDSNRNNKSKL